MFLLINKNPNVLVIYTMPKFEKTIIVIFDGELKHLSNFKYKSLEIIWVTVSKKFIINFANFLKSKLKFL